MSWVSTPTRFSATRIPRNTFSGCRAQRTHINTFITAKTTSIRRHQTSQTSTRPQSLQNISFWKCRHTWKRATVNTTRCLIGCSMGDLSTMYYLMTYHPSMNAATSMSISSERNQTISNSAREPPTDTQSSSDCRHQHINLA
jgi:enterochelin esterase-like enzyme